MRRKETINLVKSRDRGPLEFESHASENEGDVMSIAKKKVVTAPQSATIKEAAEIMVKNKFRRLPITNPGTGHILGIVTSMDILDFLGGGDKYKIFEEKYPGNFLGAINESVKEIMTRNVEVLSHKDSIKNAITKMRKKNIGALPVVDADQKMVGIVSESDFVSLLSGVLTDEVVEDYMTRKVISTTPGTRIEGASKIMVRNRLRRIPVVGEERKTSHPEKDKIMGIVTSSDILEFLGKNSAFDKMVSNNAEDVLNTTISEIMKKNIVATTAQTKLGDLCNAMEREEIGGLPVVYNGNLEGIITERDILKAVSKL